MAEAVVSLEEMARMRHAAVEEFERAEEALADIEPIHELAVGWRYKSKERIEKIDLAMATAKRAYATQRALAELATPHSPPVQFVFRASEILGPNVWNLVAVGSEGTGLYELRYWGKRGRGTGKDFAVRGEAVEPEPGTRPRHWPESRKDLWYETPEEEREAGLRRWSERGRGDFGAGTGATKPKAPPEGGRWRWLKVREQEELTSG